MPSDKTKPDDDTPIHPGGGLAATGESGLQATATSHLESHQAPGPSPEPTKGKHVVSTPLGYLNVGNHHVTPEGIEVGPKQLEDIQQAAAEAGQPLHILHGEA